MSPETVVMMRVRSSRCGGFTLIEALISITILAVSGSTLLIGVASALRATDSAVEQTIANGIAQQLMDEVAGNRYAAAGFGPYQTVLGPTGAELAGPGRSKFDDIDDFNGFAAQPLEDRWGRTLGADDGVGDDRHKNFRLPSGYFDDWRQEIDVYYVSDSDHTVALTGTQTSDYRAVEVRIYVDDADGVRRELAYVRRVFSYLPEL